MEGLTRLQEHRLELQHRLDMHRTQMEMPPSPSPSSRSLAPFSSASSSLSEGSNQPSGEDSASIVTVPFKGPPRYNPKRRSVAFSGVSSMMTTSCSASNLGTLTRIPSTEQHAVASNAGGGGATGTLTRTISVEQYSSITRVPSAEQYATTAAATVSLNRVPSTEQPYPPPPSSGTLVRVSSEEKYAPPGAVLSRASSGERYDITLTRVPSSEQYPTANTLIRVPSTEQYPTAAVGLTRVPSTDQYPSTGGGIAIVGQMTESSHHGSLGRVPSVESSRNDLPRIPSEQNGHRLTSEYQSPNSLRDPNAR